MQMNGLRSVINSNFCNQASREKDNDNLHYKVLRSKCKKRSKR